MTVTLITLLLFFFIVCCIHSYNEHIKQTHELYLNRDLSKFDRYSWKFVGVLKMIWIVIVLCGIVRLYFI